MKRIISLLFIFATMLAMIIIGKGKIVAKQVDSFPSTIKIKKDYPLVTKNGYDTFSYQSTKDEGVDVPVFCTLYHVISEDETECRVDDDSWDNKVKAGVAAIIKTANINHSTEANQMSDMYYYATLAINEFLYHYNGGNENNHISQSGSRSTKNVLGNYYYLYTKAVEAYNNADRMPNVSITKTTGKKNWNINSLISEEKPTNIYKLTFDDTTKESVTISAKTTLPSGVSVKIYKSSDGTNFTDTGKTLTSENTTINDVLDNYIKLEVNGAENLTNGESFKISLSTRGELTYDVAENYDCGADKQSLTIGYWGQHTEEDSASVTMTVNTVEVPEYPDLKIVKKDAETNELLSNATYRILYNASDANNYSRLATKRTNSDGEIVFDQIEDGFYCVQEISAPSTYFQDPKKYCFSVKMNTTNNENNIVVNSDETSISYQDNLITITLTDNKNKIYVNKTDKDGNLLKDSHFKITSTNDINADAYVLNNNPLEWDSEENSKEITGLPNGAYFLFETVAPSGYVLNADPTVILINGGMVESKTITVKNYQTSVSFQKVNIADETESLTGAHLQIVQIENNLEKVVELDGQKLEWDSKKGEPKTIIGLNPGTYYLKETQAPAGYILMTDKIKFTINEYGLVTIDEEPTKDSLVIMSNVKNKVTISKKDIAGSDELEGAYLQITDKNGKIVKIGDTELKWQSTKEPHEIEGLPVGTYILTETQAPNGYVLSTESIVFTVNEDGSVTIKDKNMKDSVVVMTNERTKVTISKQDITTKEELPGATLRLTNQDDVLVEEWVSTNEPHIIEGLPAGTYTLTEITSPDGYSLNEESITFTINADGSITGDTVMYNTPITEVPPTFSTGSFIITSFGVLILIVGVGIYIYGIKKQKQI